MLYVPLDFENGLTIDALVDSGTCVSAITHSELDRIKQQAPANIFKIDDPPIFQIQVANGQLKEPMATPKLKYKIGENAFPEHFVVIKFLTGAIIGLHFMRHNSVVIDTTYGLIHFPHLTMSAKNAASETSSKPQSVPFQDNTTLPQMTTETITIFVDLTTHRIGIQQVLCHQWEKITVAALLLISHSLSTINDQKTAVRINNTTELPYLIKKNTQMAEFSVVTPEQSKFIRPKDIAIFSMIPEGDPDLTTHLSELLRTNKPQQQSNTFCFPTPENPVKLEDHTPIQTRILKDLRELQEKDDVQSRMIFL